jgi:hypothetical protein
MSGIKTIRPIHVSAVFIGRRCSYRQARSFKTMSCGIFFVGKCDDMKRMTKIILFFLLSVSQTFAVAGVHAQDGTPIELKFDPGHGFFDQEIRVSITTDMLSSTIYYTEDGSAPGLTVSQSTRLYQNPIAINKTTVIRAIAIVPGDSESEMMTQSYLFANDVIQQDFQATLDAGFPNRWGDLNPDYGMDPDIVGNPSYGTRMEEALLSIPSLSIAMNIDDLFGADGIYTNSEEDGAEWERPGSAELIFPDQRKGFQINCGVRIQGGWFRQDLGTKKHSFRLLFKAEYGDSKLEYPLFGEEATDLFDTIVLRAGANDGYSWDGARYTEQYTRDEFGRRLHGYTGNSSPHGMFVHLYLNGIYWGLYNPVERPDDSFSSLYHGGDKNDWDVIDSGELTNGNKDAWNLLIAKCRGAASLETYMEILGKNPDGSRNPGIPVLLDVQNYIDYMIVGMWGGNWDWPWKNYRIARDRTEASRGFQSYVWDYENTMGNNRDRSPLSMDRVAGLTSMGLGVGELHVNLVKNENYRILFADRIQKHFFDGGPFTPEFLIDHYQELASEIELAIIPESARWGDQHFRSNPLTQDDWIAERDWILNTYLPQRSDIVLDQFRTANLFPAIDAPVFVVNDAVQHGGSVTSADRISMSAAQGSVYYTVDGSDPRLIDHPDPSSVSPNAIEYSVPFTLNQTTQIKARILSNGLWSALNEAVFRIPSKQNNIIISELHYHPLPQDSVDETEFEFIELENAGTETQDLSLARFVEGINYSFPDGTILRPKEYIVLASDEHYFILRYGLLPFGTYSGKLDNGGEEIILLDASGDTLISFRYNDKQPWPESADGSGYSLVTREENPSGDPNSPAYWKASNHINGSPGGDDEMVGQITDPAGFMPGCFVLEQNYPNPFNGSTTISYTLPQRALVRLTVLNICGQTVKYFKPENQPAGSYHQCWDGLDESGKDLASGVYLYKLEASTGKTVLRQSRKLLLIK